MLTGCSAAYVDEQDDSNVIVLENVESIGYKSEQGIYLNDDMKKVIADINDLGERYKDSTHEFSPIYINTYGRDGLNLKDINFNNKYIHSSEYFNDLVEILDNSLAEGLKDYIDEMENKALKVNDSIINKIGRTLIYTENQDAEEDNFISIEINFLDIKDGYYKDILSSVCDNKCILENIIMGEKLNLIEFVSFNNPHYSSNSNNFSIRYHMFFDDRDIEKINILLKGKNEGDLTYDDMTVFINLINCLDLGENEKNILVDEYKYMSQEKTNIKKINLNNYNVLINYNKANTISGKDRRLIYFSIERN